MPPRAAYLHVPFCRHRCGYCNFTVIAGRDELATKYLQALARELSGLEQPRDVDTIFLGGGTPTHLTLPELDELLTLVQYWFPLAAGGEFSVEANPRDTLDVEKLALLRARGATRLSLGVQSFDGEKLRLLERDHDADVIRQAVQNARAVGFDVSLDLIFGAPGETRAGWQRDLEQALALSPDHLSTYGLTFEKGTTFWGRLTRGELVQAEEDLEREMYLLGIETLTAAGFEHYEVSNFARAGHRCRHNEAYWLGREYFAAGPGAARYVAGRRSTNHRSTTTWIARVMAGESPVAESEALSPEEMARERLVFGLRRLEGHDIEAFARETGFTIDDLAGPRIAQFVEQGYLSRDAGRLRLTRAGLLISDALWPYLLRP
jgi:oxygen-independent coproporphyrinogen-3 oxidase